VINNQLAGIAKPTYILGKPHVFLISWRFGPIGEHLPIFDHLIRCQLVGIVGPAWTQWFRESPHCHCLTIDPLATERLAENFDGRWLASRPGGDLRAEDGNKFPNAKDHTTPAVRLHRGSTPAAAKKIEPVSESLFVLRYSVVPGRRRIDLRLPNKPRMLNILLSLAVHSGSLALDCADPFHRGKE
jgi:hypothetical protein